MQVSCVDLFCGAGGLTHGLIKGGISVEAGIDIDPACRYPYEKNNGSRFIEEKVEDISPKEIKKLFKPESYSLLAGCAPCQPFSNYSRGRGERNQGKWSLLKEFGELAQTIKPDLITMENVPELEKHDVFLDFLKHLSGYHVWHGVVECKRYGLPQQRKRLVLLASRFKPIALIPYTHDETQVVTVKQAIGKLPPLKSGETDKRDPLHKASKLTKINLDRIRASKPGGTWKDWPNQLVAACHTKSTGSTYSGVYGRMEWDKPAPTMTTLCYGYGNGRFGHPESDRGISLREAAIFQSFPNDYEFVPPGETPQFRIIGRLIGNAVPVRLGEVIAESIREHLLEVDGVSNL